MIKKVDTACYNTFINKSQMVRHGQVGCNYFCRPSINKLANNKVCCLYKILVLFFALFLAIIEIEFVAAVVKDGISFQLYSPSLLEVSSAIKLLGLEII